MGFDDIRDHIREAMEDKMTVDKDDLDIRCQWCGIEITPQEAVVWDVTEAELELGDDGKPVNYEETGLVHRHLFCSDDCQNAFMQSSAEYGEHAEEEPYQSKAFDVLPENSELMSKPHDSLGGKK